MDDIVNTVDLCDPVEAYVRPIRSVLFIDDQFPTFAADSESTFNEAERARALWRACTERGWLCDIDNSPDWTSRERKQRLAACDLLVLDYHLIGGDSGPALAIIRDLARSGTPNLVVVYTADPDPDVVLLTVATWARGVRLDTLLSEELEDFEDSIEWSSPDLLAFLSNKPDWKTTLNAACERAGVNVPDDSGCSALLERELRRRFGAEPSEEICHIDCIRGSEHRWLQCGNLFLVVLSKPTEEDAGKEATTFLGGLEEAVRQWAPSWLACLVAVSRRRVEIGAFRDDVLLPDEILQKGFLGYISDSTSDPPEQARRAKEIATYLLSRRSADAAKALGEHLLARAVADNRGPLVQLDLLHLNAFLCSEPFLHHHLHVGTIFALRTEEPQYWVCVTPACDMVPRRPDEIANPWAFELDTFRPMAALRLKHLPQGSDKWKKAIKEAHLGRHLFFWDRTVDGERPLVAACFKDTADPNPSLEQMLAVDLGRVQTGDSVELYRLVAPKNEAGQVDAPRLDLIACEPVAQLRAPYAERVVQVVGGHVSRIGVNFVRFKSPK